MEACSHGRSWQLFVESVFSDVPYMASKCLSLSYLTNGGCEGNEIAMGEPTPSTARGVYYIKTTISDPNMWNISEYLDHISSNDLDELK